jgi:predicted DsbA family dithiol-disulfide isomerase
MKPKIRIDVVSDVVCPWCYIGKKRLEKAMINLKDEFDFEMQYHPFELNTSIPAGGVASRDYMIEKFGGEDRYEQLTGRVAQVAATEGLTMDFDKQIVTPNTRKAHALIARAAVEGKQLKLVDAFFKAYFTDGVDLSKDENLVSIAVNNGLSQESAETVIKDEDALLGIAMEEQEVQKLGITGVPFYIINRKFGVSGAQTPEHFVEVLREASIESVSGDTCDVDKGEC